MAVRFTCAAYVRGLRARAFPVNHRILFPSLERCWSDDLGRFEELYNCFPSARPDGDHLPCILVGRVVQFHTGGSRSCGRECD